MGLDWEVRDKDGDRPEPRRPNGFTVEPFFDGASLYRYRMAFVPFKNPRGPLYDKRNPEEMKALADAIIKEWGDADGILVAAWLYYWAESDYSLDPSF